MRPDIRRGSVSECSGLFFPIVVPTSTGHKIIRWPDFSGRDEPDRSSPFRGLRILPSRGLGSAAGGCPLFHGIGEPGRNASLYNVRMRIVRVRSSWYNTRAGGFTLREAGRIMIIGGTYAEE